MLLLGEEIIAVSAPEGSSDFIYGVTLCQS